LTSPGPQGVWDKKEAEGLATQANDYMAEQCKKNPKRFSWFASVSMHDPKQAAQELRRAVKELGLVGAMFATFDSVDGRINDFQSAGPDGETMLMYDQPDYDPFWAAVEELDVLVYMHPRLPVPHIQKELWDDRAALSTAPLQFGQDVQRHTLGLCVNGTPSSCDGLIVRGIRSIPWRQILYWPHGRRMRQSTLETRYLISSRS
jgi:2,3-dihydroxybenzoate decarboxylase